MKLHKASLILILLSSFFATSLVSAQSPNKQASVTIEGEVKSKLVLTPADTDKLPKTTITAKDRSGKENTYTGVELSVLLKSAGVSLGEDLKGENLSKYLLVEASDGYQVIFSLPEVDPEFTSRKIILANRKDGELFSVNEGPFRIIIDGEKKLPRNVRQVVSLKIKFVN